MKYCETCGHYNVCKDKADYVVNCPDYIEPVRHGKWINEPPYKAVDGTWRKGQECSVCHAYFVSDGNKPYRNHPYCCECGAKMEGE